MKKDNLISLFLVGLYVISDQKIIMNADLT